MKAFVWLRVVALANRLQPLFMRHPALYKALLAPGLGGLRRRVSAWRAWANAVHAYRNVPAYRAHVDAHGGLPKRCDRDGLPDLTLLPETDKASYVQRHPQEARCLGGQLPRFGVAVDESSGSSGTPTSWVRGPEERWATRQMLQLSFRSALGDEPFFVINAFALGAWATGMNVTSSLSDVCIMKSTGPDIDKIVATLQEFGPNYDYVVLGYPPFLKTLADDRRVDWHQFRVRAVFGGEGLSEPLRDYLLKSFTDVLGSYGASDLEINMAAESPFTVRLRREIAADPALRARLTDPRHASLPMIFQYNPLAYHLETNAGGELVVTLNRRTNVAPKIRYNIHDFGHVAEFDDVATALSEVTLGHLVAQLRPVSLPLLFLYGRSDLSIDYYGANVTPDSVGEALFSIDELARDLHSFRLLAPEDEQHNTTMEVAIELVDGAAPDAIDPVVVGRQIFGRLARTNGDFRNAYHHTATRDRLPRVSLHRRGTGPFDGPARLKHQYVA